MKNKVKKIMSGIIRKVTEGVTGDLSQELNTASGEKYSDPEISALLRKAAAEGIVLLKNDGVLPLKKDEEVAVFGRCQINWFSVGYGSGGDVKAPYKVNLMDGMKNCGIRFHEGLAGVYSKWCSDPDNVPDEGFWGNWPRYYEEMPLTAEQVIYTSTTCRKALFIVGRAAGEDRENTLSEGSYYLTETEKKNLKLICSHFRDVIVILDCGNLIDMEWTEEYSDSIKAILLAGQGGQESGNAVADVLCGNVNPSGKLTDTIAKKYEYYPSADNFGGYKYNNYAEDIYVGYRYFETFAKEKVLYPFGFGLSYTEFTEEPKAFRENDGKYHIEVSVKNTGSLAGSEVVELYVKAPCGKLGKAERSLLDFKKTSLLEAGKSETVTFDIDKYQLASYDDEGKTGNRSCFVLEKGRYTFFAGSDVRTETVAGEISVETTEVIKKLHEVCIIEEPFARLVNSEENGQPVMKHEMLEKGRRDLKARILENIPVETGYMGFRGYKLQDVKDGKITLGDFVSQLTGEELESLSRGEGCMDSAYGTEGNAGAYGGITEALRKQGIPAVITSDGPSGVRVKRYTSLLPCGTTLASTWNKELVRKIFELQADELEKFDIDVLLAPGMNIHRNPLCGRNFEYFSEDPVVSGEMAAAAVMGIQKNGRSACPKHFACNNQEVKRNTNDSRVSERALREIYLRGFEIAVKKAKPMNIMTSYNKINGVWSHYNYDLVTTVLRKEWHYDGVVITDWWMQKSVSPEFMNIRDNAYRVRAQVDVLMPGNMNRLAKKYVNDGTLTESVGEYGGMTRGEMERTACNVLSFVLKRM